MRVSRASLPVVLALLLGCPGLVPRAHGDELVRRVQEELRRRQLYFGDVDGRISAEVEGALRRYQARKGFAVTGKADRDTANSLGAIDRDPAAPPFVQAALPEVPVLKSDAARQLSEKDRSFLEKLETASIEPVGEDGTAAPTEPAAVSSPGLGNAEPAVLSRDAETFVRDYLAACETNSLDAEMAFYADRVDYFDHGMVGRDFIQTDVGRYYKRWPQRDYELLSLQVAPGKDEGEVTAKFRLRFKMKNGELSASGITRNTFTIRRAADGMKFTTLREQRERR